MAVSELSAVGVEQTEIVSAIRVVGSDNEVKMDWHGD